MKREVFTGIDGKEISIAVWDEVKNPKAVVQISHGMAEHIERYDDFALYLNSNRFIVFGDDHRAHGQTDSDALGLVGASTDLFSDTVSDLMGLTAWAKEKWELPVIFFGHSYGSYLGQEYLTKASGDIIGAVLSGSGLFGGLITSFGIFMAGGKSKQDKPGNFFAGITFDSYDKKVKDGKNGWLSRDKESNEKYNADDRCGFICSNGFYKSFFRGLKRNAKSDFAAVRKDLPLLIAYGQQDHVGGCGKLVSKLTAKYKKAGLEPAVKAYEGARHEILNETNKDEVYEDILSFFASFV